MNVFEHMNLIFKTYSVFVVMDGAWTLFKSELTTLKTYQAL